jgi:hypothetical protein
MDGHIAHYLKKTPNYEVSTYIPIFTDFLNNQGPKYIPGNVNASRQKLSS